MLPHPGYRDCPVLCCRKFGGFCKVQLTQQAPYLQALVAVVNSKTNNLL